VFISMSKRPSFETRASFDKLRSALLRVCDFFGIALLFFLVSARLG